MGREAGFRYPVAVTAAVWAVVNEYENNKFMGQSWQGRLWDVFAILKWKIRSAPEGADTIDFEPLFIRGTSTRPRGVDMWCKIGPGDTSDLVFTIILKSED